ncbi:hypothetical protein N9322_01135 [bacterium]|jgi:hypothetical protein|nr:hypothetical protein [bacterium]|tara:strand:- start:10137 stop:11342 length:1206 start_codon:yes stop_codon:yes gene_type:complete
MALKPIGSEKLKGQDKINRIMEIATYGEVEKNTAYHTQTVSFSKKASDGNTYAIVNEKDGYYLKRGINESELDYIDGLQNKKRNRFRSYGAALKRMNLIFKPLNEEFNNGESTPLYEQSDTENKFVLKTPEAEVDVTTDEMGDEEELDMGDEELAMDDEELDMDDEEVEMDDEETEEEMEGFMKPIQKLTGKLGQKLRDAGEELGSADIKYVLNSVISAVDLDTLDTEDKDDVLSRFEEDETAYGDEELGDEELAMDDEDLDIDVEDIEGEGEGEEFDMSAMMPESRKKRKNVISGAKTLKGKSEVKEGVAMKSLKNRVSQLLESYVTKQTPQDYIKEAVEKNKLSNTIKKLSKTIEQEIRVKKYLKENKYSRVKGLTKKGNIVILSDNKNIFVNKEGKIQ